MTRHRIDSMSLLIVAVTASLGLILGCLAAVALGGQERFVAKASVAMLPGPKVDDSSMANYWEVLNRGQATRTAAAVISEPRWLEESVGTRAADAQSLNLTAGAVPDTTLIEVTVTANTTAAATQALSAVLEAALPTAATSSGPFALQVVSDLTEVPTAQTPDPTQLLVALGAAGGLVGAGIGLVGARALARRRSGRRSGMDSAPSEPWALAGDAADVAHHRG